MPCVPILVSDLDVEPCAHLTVPLPAAFADEDSWLSFCPLLSVPAVASHSGSCFASVWNRVTTEVRSSDLILFVLGKAMKCQSMGTTSLASRFKIVIFDLILAVLRSRIFD